MPQLLTYAQNGGYTDNELMTITHAQPGGTKVTGSVPQHVQRKPADESFRITPKRRTVLETLKSRPGGHLTAEEIHRTARAKGSN